MNPQTSNNQMDSEENGVVRSADGRDPATEIPSTSFIEFLMSRLRTGLPQWGPRPWVVDVVTGESVTFSQAESQSRLVASALNRRGFRPGDVLYYVTYEMAQLYVVHVAVWRLGGAVRGCFQNEMPQEYARQIKETGSRFVLVDAETWPLLHEASTKLEWPVTFLSVGKVTVPGATAFSQLLQDDGSECPEIVDVDPREDVVSIPNTSGSTGLPKGVLHTHYSAIASLLSLERLLPHDSLMAATINYGLVNFMCATHALSSGCTVYHIRKFNKDQYFDLLIKYKPRHVVMYAYVASWFARCGSQLARLREADFLESIWLGGWVLDHTTTQLLAAELPNTFLTPMYGMSECSFVAVTTKEENRNIGTLEISDLKDVSSGKLIPFVEGKVVDPGSGLTLGRGELGELHIRSPCMMKGYLKAAAQPNCSDIDAQGWLRTGDAAYFDPQGNVYIKERLTFMFKYYMNFISPSEIECVLQEHAAVQGAGVVGMPNPDTDNLARAFVVLRHDCSATAGELEKHVAQRLPPHKHLHGGVRFVDKLPENRGGKLDRAELKKIALSQEDE